MKIRFMSAASALYCAALFLLLHAPVYAGGFFGGGEEVVPYDKFIISLLSENDAYFDSMVDKYYSAGTRIGFTSSEMDFAGEAAEKHPWLAAIGKLGLAAKPRVTKFNIYLNQEIYTPKDKVEFPDEKDRPYAGYLYLSLGLTNRNNDMEEHLWLDVGIVGPASLAQQTQDFIHLMVNHNSALPGWGTQLDNEPALNIHYQITRKYNLFVSKYFSSDTLLTADTALGNVDIHLGADMRLRFGYNLEADFGVPKVNMSYNASAPHSNDFSVYIFGGAGGRIVGRNIFLSGNTFSGGTGLRVNPFIYDFEFGAAILFKGFRISYIYTYKSKEFTTQDTGTNVGSILLDMAF